MFWHLVTRLGEMQIVLPAALLASWPAFRRPETRSFAWRWLGALALAIALTTATKLAFIGWGLGISAINFTGISGHAMMAASVYPVLLALLASKWSKNIQWMAFFCGVALAILVGYSRLQVHAHSASEVIAGLVLGAAVCAACVWRQPLPQQATGPVVQCLVLAWMLLTPIHTPQAKTHQLVTRLSLALAGHDTPHTRADLLRRASHAP